VAALFSLQTKGCINDKSSGSDREVFQASLARAGKWHCRPLPIPIHQQSAYQHLGYSTGRFSVSRAESPANWFFLCFRNCAGPAGHSRCQRWNLSSRQLLRRDGLNNDCHVLRLETPPFPNRPPLLFFHRDCIFIRSLDSTGSPRFIDHSPGPLVGSTGRHPVCHLSTTAFQTIFLGCATLYHNQYTSLCLCGTNALVRAAGYSTSRACRRGSGFEGRPDLSRAVVPYFRSWLSRFL